MKSFFMEKIIWAFDALEDQEHHKNAFSLLDAISRATSARIEPVYILNPPVTDVKPAALEQAFVALGEKRLLELPSQSKIATMVVGKVIVNHDASVRKHVHALLDYANSQNADAIVVGTHGRKGTARLLLGSFAETLALYSNLPLFTVNPAAEVRENFSKILFPTTFYPHSRPDFARAVELTKALNAKLTLFYKEPSMIGPLMSPEIYRYIEQEAIKRVGAAAEWQKWAADYGVETEVKIDNQPGPLVPALMDLASAGHFDLIAMGTQADAISAIMMGSAARKIIRHAPCPVWVIRSEKIV